MALEALMAATQATGNIVDIAGNLFGGTVSGSGSSTSSGTTKGTTTEKLVIQEEAVTRTLEELLSGTEGLASVFGGEQTAGIFDSSVVAEQAGDLISKVVAEIAALQAEKVATVDTKTTGKTTSKQEQKDEGVLSGIGDFFGF